MGFFFPSQNNPKNLDLLYKMDLDIFEIVLENKIPACSKKLT